MEIEKAILEDDGSLRDINIDNVDIPKVYNLIEHLNESYVLSSAWSNKGQDVESLIANPGLRSDVFDKDNGYVHSFWQKPENLIRDLQVFFSWDVKGEIFTEFSFSPRDVDVEKFNMDRFMDFLKPIIKTSGTQRFYVRYENGSWEYGDVSQYSGVIFYNLDAQKI